MGRNSFVTLITGIFLFILVIAALKFAVRVLLPIAIIVIAAYIVYVIITGKRKRW